MNTSVKTTSPSVGRPRKVSRQQVVAAALEVMESAGFAALSMRSLARQLGINHATLYNYIGSIAELEVAALDELMLRIPIPDRQRPEPMRQQLIEHLLAVHQVQLLYPKFCQAPPGSGTWRLHMKCMADIMAACAEQDEQLEAVAMAYNALICVIASNAERSRVTGDSTPIRPYLEAVAELPVEEFEPLFRPLRRGGYSKPLSSFVYRLDYLINQLLPFMPELDEPALAELERSFAEQSQ